MNNEHTFYTDLNFSEQLKKIRCFRGFKTQAILCKKLNISRQVWSLWELNKRKPTIPQLIELANFLEVDICYFFITGAPPEEHDLTIDRTRIKYEESDYKESNNPVYHMPFTETIVSKQLFKIFDQCRITKGVYAVTVFADSGNTRAIEEYRNLFPDNVEIIKETHFHKADFNTQGNTATIIFDDADKLPDDILEHIITSVSRQMMVSIILIGKKIKEVLIKNGLLDYIHDQFSVDCITTGDFNKIVRAVLPAVSESVLNYLRIETSIRLKKLFDILKRIDDEKKSKPNFILSINSIVKLGNQI